MTGETICFQSFAAARARAQGSLPENPGLLAAYHRAANDLLEMLAERVEPDWEKAEAALADIDRLLALQEAIVERVAKRPAGTLQDVLAKLTLWSAAREGCEEDGMPEDALVLAALRDLERLLRAA
jgi:hypothetical protein